MATLESKRDTPKCVVENVVTATLLAGWMTAHPRVTLNAIRTNGFEAIVKSQRALVKSLH